MNKNKLQTNDQLEKMFKAFDQFIQDYHSNSGDEEDVEVVKKWAALKKVI